MPWWILIGAQKSSVTVEDAALKMKNKLIYVSHQIKFAALRAHLMKINLEKEDIPVIKEVCTPGQKGIGL